ncbi:hypothetical protein MGYG_08932 [Nannizzia gypsea CBS 118893]|uniref:Uncharacterized protein n=1 Tax=Arthroderma gypseum (strain ATCC MYA-4604 / CBS 118893) TaxID=535722 RepID=E5R0Y3_ARTGP|nr:hypothetical protein MGYG_08932 [Nannizzia gypsea CBS 118893]EFQ98425.1 hypothetical protein MGYG_08932 [Nannizzia gypsea CBS 118893]
MFRFGELTAALSEGAPQLASGCPSPTSVSFSGGSTYLQPAIDSMLTCHPSIQQVRHLSTVLIVIPPPVGIEEVLTASVSTAKNRQQRVSGPSHLAKGLALCHLTSDQQAEKKRDISRQYVPP